MGNEANTKQTETFATLQTLSDYLVNLDNKDVVFASRANCIRLTLINEVLTDGSVVANVEIYS